MGKPRRKSGRPPVTTRKGRIKSKTPKGGGGSPTQNRNLNVPMKRQTRSEKRAADMQYAVSHLNEIKDSFVANRKFSVSKINLGNNVQVTCTNNNDSQPSTSQTLGSFDNQMDHDDGNLSLASYGEKLLKRKLSFERKMFKNVEPGINVENVSNNEGIQSLDFISTNTKAPETSRMVDDSLIVIDDDSSCDVIELNETHNEIVDLTTPQQTPAKTNSSLIDLTTPRQTAAKTTSSNQKVPVWSIPNPFEQKTFIPPIMQQQQFPSISVLTQPIPPSFEPPISLPISSELFGTNFLNAGNVRTVGLRPIFIDGNNVALGHSNGKFFSVKGLKICIDYFKIRGHEVTAIVPQIRKRRNQNSDLKLLLQLESDGTVVFTPSRVINGRNVIPYDDRFIVQLAAVHLGVIISCDNYRDLLAENPNLRDTIENRVLNPTFVKDMLIFPSDPLGRWGPKLDEFLRFP